MSHPLLAFHSSMTLSLSTVKSIFAASTMYPQVLSLFPAGYQDLLDDDDRLHDITVALRARMANQPLTLDTPVHQYYRDYTPDAARFVYRQILMLLG